MRWSKQLLAATLLLAAGDALLAQMPKLTDETEAQRAARIASSTDCNTGKPDGECLRQSAILTHPTKPNGYGHASMIWRDFQTYGPASNWGNAGGWTITSVVAAPHVIFGTRGIDQYQSANIMKNGTGDLGGLYYYVYGGGRAAQSDEGTTGITVESGEIPGYFHGTIAGSARTGATALDLAPAASGAHNWAYTCDGCMLLDISKGVITGSLAGHKVPFFSYLNQLPTANVTVNGSPARLPLTHAWCATLSAIPPTATAGLGTARTVSCTLGHIGNDTPAFKAGGVVTIGGRFYPEQATLVAAETPVNGVQSLTLLARNPNPVGSLIFQGGIAGQSLSFDENLAFSGFRTSYYVFGSVDGMHLIFGSQIGGSVGENHNLPRPGADAESETSGFHLYPSAEVVANTEKPSSPQLEPNEVPWETGDTVENPRFQSVGGAGIFDVCSIWTPTDESGTASCLALHLHGTGIAGTYHPFHIENDNPLSMYLQGGGKLSPVPAIEGSGPFGDLISFTRGPSTSVFGYNAVIDIRGTAEGDNTPYNLFALSDARNLAATTMTYDPAVHRIGFPQGLTTGAMSTLQNCSAVASPANCLQAAAGSFVIPAGANSVTVQTDKVTANSQILVTADISLSAKLGVTCETSLATAFAPFGITARVPGHSFTLSIAGSAGTTPNCYSFELIN